MGGHALIDVLREIHLAPKRLQSNYVRDHAQLVARLASTGLITTRFDIDGLTFFGVAWRVTYSGLRVLELSDAGASGEPE